VKVDLPLELAEYHLVEGTSDEQLLVAQHLMLDGQSTREEFISIN
jgi:hypothetical protein